VPPARGRVVVCLVFVCKYVLGHSRVSQPLNLRLCLLRHLGFLTWPHTLGGRRKAKTKTAGKVTERAWQTLVSPRPLVLFILQSFCVSFSLSLSLLCVSVCLSLSVYVCVFSCVHTEVTQTLSSLPQTGMKRYLEEYPSMALTKPQTAPTKPYTLYTQTR